MSKENAVAQLSMIVADAMPIELLIEQLEEAINDYKINPTDETRRKIAFNSQLFLIKEAISMSGGNVSELMDRFEKHDAADKLLKTNPH